MLHPGSLVPVDAAGRIDRFANLGALPSDTDDMRVRKATLTLSTALFGLLAAIWGTVYLVLGFPVAGSIPLVYVLLSAAGLGFFGRTKRYGFFRASQLGLLLVLPFLMQVSLGGFHASSGVLLWGFAVPLGALVFYGPRQSIPWFAAYLVVVVSSAILDPSIADEGRHVPTPTVVTFFILNIGGVALSSYLLLHYFVRERDRMKAALDRVHRLLLREQEKSERLLLNVLPRAIADRLKETDGIIADTSSEVSVLFADIVGFTALAERLPAERVVDLLNELFSAFDGLAEERGLEKIKTIGDAYMVAAGLPARRPDHAEAIADMALTMRDAVARHSERIGLPLAVRIGIDSGPVVAGVIGRKKFAYDLWGDTVNSASRMESTGLPGEIQVTERTYRLLREAYRFVERGPVPVKGKGMMSTYLLGGTRTPADGRIPAEPSRS